MHCTSLNSRLPTLFRSDSQLAIGQAQGSIGSLHCDMSFQALRGSFQLLDAILGDDLAIEHVYGHAGDPWNEMADTIAKQEARTSFFLPRPQISFKRFVRKLPYLWMIFRKDHGLPVFAGSGFDVRAPRFPASKAPTSAISRDPPDVRPVHFQLSFATANVLSLGRKDQGFAGKLHYLRQQFRAHHLNFIGIQEARSDEGMSCVDGTLRLCSGAHQGNWGVEFWVSLRQPYGHLCGRPLYFQKKDFHVAHRDSRRLLIHILNDHLRFWCLVAHAPQSGIDLTARTTWWQETHQILQSTMGPEDQLVACLDANAGPGEPDQSHILQAGFKHSSSTPLLRQFLEDFELCLPITSEKHIGSSTTWIGPDDGEYTIDYVAIPMSWYTSCTSSQVLSDFDLANMNVDHTAVALQLEWIELLPQRLHCQDPLNSFDRQKISRAPLQNLASIIGSTWDEDVETHANRVTGHIKSMLCKQFPPDKRGAKKPYLSQELWQLRKHKLALRRRLHHRRTLQRRELLCAVFHAWKFQDNKRAQFLDGAFNYATSLRIATMRCVGEFRCVSRKLKRDIAAAKQDQLRSTLEQITPATPASLIQKMLRPFKGPSNRLRQGLHSGRSGQTMSHGRRCTGALATVLQ